MNNKQRKQKISEWMNHPVKRFKFLRWVREHMRNTLVQVKTDSVKKNDAKKIEEIKKKLQNKY